jgi:hypothetical protein
MLIRSVRRALRLLNRIFYSLYVAPLKEAVIDFTDLSLSHKILAVGGYLSIALVLVLTLLFELFSGELGLVTYTFSTGEAWVTKQIPTLVMITSSLGVLLGWAFLLTGATDCHPFVFVPVLGFFGFQLFALSAGALSEEGSWLELLFCLTAPVLLMGTLGLYLLTHRKSYWRNLALVEFAIWFCVMLFYVTGHWLVAPDAITVAETLEAIFNILAILAVPWWMVSGLVLVSLALDTGRKLTMTLRRIFPESMLRAITIFVMLLYPGLLVFAIALGDEAAPLVMSLVANGFLVLPLILVMVGLALFKRLTMQRVAMLLTLTFTLPVFTLGVAMALGGVDIGDVMGMSIQSTGVLPPTLVFVALMAYNVLSVGANFSDKDGKYLPRSGRILLGFGVALLVTSFTVFFANIRDPVTGNANEELQIAIDAFFAVGLFFLGLPYFIWRVWKRRDTLSGDEEALADTIPVFAWLEESLGRKGALLLTIAAVIVACLICVVGMLLIEPISVGGAYNLSERGRVSYCVFLPSCFWEGSPAAIIVFDYQN